MGLISYIKLKNFKNIRDAITISFLQSTYLIGVNNAGKTNVLHGVRAFFDDNYFSDGSFLNKTEYARKKAGSNRSEITLKFDLKKLTTKTRKAALIKQYGDDLVVTKKLNFTSDSKTVSISWKINNGGKDVAKLPDDLMWLFKSVKLTYIHPQEGKLLLKNVQRRLRQRLLANWGRGSSVTHSIKDLESMWSDMRTTANKYLSQSLSNILQTFWPGCSIQVDLPKNIREIIDVSDINFQGYKSAPEIELTSQGSGAQSTVLYLAHYLLDSDRSLNRGEYHPIWLMEEPESFLHADLLLKLSAQINSEDWLGNIQMIISTHSPILLASSRSANDKVVWNVLDGDGKIDKVKPVDESDERIIRIGLMMGDPNFFAYFTIAQNSRLIFIEDEKKEILEAFSTAGLSVTKGLGGIANVKKCLDVLKTVPGMLKHVAYFVLDSDDGIEQIENYMSEAKLIAEEDGFKKFKLWDQQSVFVITLPDGMAVEPLFDQYNEHLDECFDEIWNEDFSVRDKTLSILSRVVDKARKNKVESKDDAIMLIRNLQDIKDQFWRKVSKYNYQMSAEKVSSLMRLMA